jgi:protein tyrosine phosphatase (PTP) superfamily phosphohydrolase (DUF442 family)
LFTRIKISDIPVIIRGFLHNFFRWPIPMDFDFVTERLAVGGGIATARDVECLKKAGITHVIDMRAEFNDAAMDALKEPQRIGGFGLNYLWLPQKDDGTPRDPQQYAQGIRFAMEALDELPHKVYCHCADGVNRGPTMAYAILRAFGISRPGAIFMIRVKRPCVDFYNVPNYIDSVEKLFA